MTATFERLKFTEFPASFPVFLQDIFWPNHNVLAVEKGTILFVSSRSMIFQFLNHLISLSIEEAMNV